MILNGIEYAVVLDEEHIKRVNSFIKQAEIAASLEHDHLQERLKWTKAFINNMNKLTAAAGLRVL